MACPICDQKPANCDCTDAEKRMYSETEDLEIEIERLRGEVARLRKLGADVCHLLQGSPVGSGCYEAHRMLDEQLTPESK